MRHRRPCGSRTTRVATTTSFTTPRSTRSRAPMGVAHGVHRHCWIAPSSMGGRVSRACSDAPCPEFYGRSSIKGMVHRYFFTRSVPGEDHYLATLVHDMGRDRFARFWRSSEPAEEAFAAAFGQPMDQWTAMWARNVAPDLPPFGPAPRPIAVLYAVGLAALAAGLAAAAVMRRQVS